MKRSVLLLAVLLPAGCATETHRVQNGDGAKHLNDQPQNTVTAEGGLMRGEVETEQIPTGQFTGQERTVSQIGQYPTPSGKSDPRELNDRKGEIGSELKRPE